MLELGYGKGLKRHLPPPVRTPLYNRRAVLFERHPCCFFLSFTGCLGSIGIERDLRIVLRVARTGLVIGTFFPPPFF